MTLRLLLVLGLVVACGDPGLRDRSLMAKLKDAAKGDDAAAINGALEELAQAGQALYQHMAADSAAADESAEAEPAAASAAASDEDVIDAEFEKKDD